MICDAYYALRTATRIVKYRSRHRHRDYLVTNGQDEKPKRSVKRKTAIELPTERSVQMLQGFQGTRLGSRSACRCQVLRLPSDRRLRSPNRDKERF